MDDITLAMLGDHSAAEKVTESGKLLPCPLCGGEVDEHGPEDWKPTWNDPDSGGDPVEYSCKCGFSFCIGSYDYYETRKAYNTRAPILPPEKIKRLEEKDHETDL